MSVGLALSVERRVHAIREARHYGTDVLTRLAQLPEDQLLNFFWLMVREGGQGLDRLELLLMLSAMVVPRPAGWDPAAVREAYERGDETGTAVVQKDRCFACSALHEALYFHHIVEIQNGGSNAIRNRVPLCFPCHQYLHPWLQDHPAAPAASGLEPFSAWWERRPWAADR